MYMAFHKVSNIDNNVKPLPANTQALVTVSKSRVVVQDKDSVEEVAVPKFGTIRVRVADTGQVVLESANWLPRLGVRPYVGAAYTGRLEPILGIQVLRIEPIQLGLSLDVTPSLLGVSINKDVSDNAIAGLGTGISAVTMQQQFYVFLSLSF
jgi:hypothetical protein